MTQTFKFIFFWFEKIFVQRNGKFNICVVYILRYRNDHEKCKTKLSLQKLLLKTINQLFHKGIYGGILWYTHLLCCVWQFEPLVALNNGCTKVIPHPHQLVNEGRELLGLRVPLIYQLLAYFYYTEYSWLVVLYLSL